MKVTRRVKRILSGYESSPPGVKANLARILMAGRLGGSGRLLILPVDQGWEHGPARSFAANPPAYDPHYHFQLAIAAGLSAYAAPLGFLEAGADSFAGALPLILKANNANSLATSKDQAVTASVGDALRLGCAAIGFTVYPGSEHQFEMVEEVREMADEARACGLATVVWSYPRGGQLTREGETALDVIAYAAHLACQIGADIVKVKPPTATVWQQEAQQAYADIDRATLGARVAHVVRSAFAGRRLVVFSGGAAKGREQVLAEIREIAAGGGAGSIVGRNAFQRPWDDALAMLDAIVGIYREQERGQGR